MSKKISYLLVEARERAGLTQTEVAYKSGLQPSAISHFETGRRTPSAANLRKLADALGANVDFLLGREIKPTAAGPAISQLMKDFVRMSAADQENLTRFATMLANKNSRRSSS